MPDIAQVVPLGVTTYTERKRAEAQVNQLVRIDRQSDIIVRKYTQAVRQAALYALRYDKKLELSDDDINRATIELVGLSLLAYATAVKNFHVQQPELQLASSRNIRTQFDKDVARVAKNFDIDVGTLSKRLHSIVAPNMRDSLHKVRKEINSTLGDISAKKIPTRQATSLLTKRLEEMGVAPNRGGYVETLVRTHSQLAYNAAQHIELEKDDSIWGYKYVTVGDDRVRQEHERLDGLVKKRDHPIWGTIWPPNGWNCRCQVLVIYDEDEAETRLPNNVKTLVDPAFRFNPGLELV